FTHSIAPIPAFLAPLVITALYLRQRERSGTLGLVGYVLNFLGLAGALVIEYVLHYVFPLLPQATVTALTDGRTGAGFLAIGVVCLAGIVLFGLAMWRADVLPRAAIACYVLGLATTALRPLLPASVVSTGFVVGSVAVIWLSATLAEVRVRQST